MSLVSIQMPAISFGPTLIFPAVKLAHLRQEAGRTQVLSRDPTGGRLSQPEIPPLAPALTQSVQPPFTNSQRQATRTRNRQHHPAQFGQALQASDGRITRMRGLAHIIQKLVPVIWAHGNAPVWVA